MCNYSKFGPWFRCYLNIFSILGQNFFISSNLIYDPSNCNFQDGREKKILKKIIFYPPTLNIICFVEKKIHF